MNSTQLDTEYHDFWDGQPWDEELVCGEWKGGLDGKNCQRPAGHNGDHAAILGMDPNANDWVTFDGHSWIGDAARLA